MELITQLRIGHRSCTRRVQVVLILSIMPLLLAAVILFAYRGRGGPGLWMVAGISLAHALILWGAHRMHSVTMGRSAFGSRMVQRSDRWFPYVILLVQGGVASSFALLVWFTLRDLGLKTTTLHFAFLLALLLLWPIRRCMRFAELRYEKRWMTRAHEILLFLYRIATTLFAAETLACFTRQSAPRYGAGFPLLDVLLWAVAILAVLIQFVLFLDRMTRKASREAEPANIRKDTIE